MEKGSIKIGKSEFTYTIEVTNNGPSDGSNSVPNNGPSRGQQRSAGGGNHEFGYSYCRIF